MAKAPKIDLRGFSLEELKALELEVAKEIELAEEHRRRSAISELEDVAEAFGYSLGELIGAKPKKASRGMPKYRDPENPEQTWTGRGRRPQWIKEAIENGVRLETYEM